MANATATAEAAVASIRSQNPEMRLDGARKVRKLLSPCRRCAKETDPPVQEVLDAGLLDDLIGCLAAGNDTKLQFEAAWAITNIASSDQTYVVVDAGACPILIELLTSESHDVREQCIWCLGNVAGDRVAYRDELLNHATMMPALLQNFEYEMGQESPNMSLLRNATWLLSNLCRAKPVPAFALLQPALPYLKKLLMSNDADILSDACWAASYLTDGDDARIEGFVRTGVVERFCELMQHNSDTITTPAVRVIGNIVSGNDMSTQSVVDAGGIGVLGGLMDHKKKSVRKEVCWALSNITAGSIKQIKDVLRHGAIIRKAVSLMAEGEWDVRKEACYIVCNAMTTGKDDEVQKCAEGGAIKGMCTLLQANDVKIILVVLESMEVMLKLGVKRGTTAYTDALEEEGGIDALENLQEHENNDVYEKAAAIVEKFFGGEDGSEDENVAPAFNPVAAGDSGATKTFSFGSSNSAAAPSRQAGGFSFGGSVMGN